MNTRRTASILTASILVAMLVPRAWAVTKASNNTFGSYDKPPAELTIGEIAGQFVAGKVWKPHSGISAWDGVIRDDEFQSLLTSSLIDAGVRKHDSLLIDMNQCYSGGFVDEIEASMSAAMITTASAWNRPAAYAKEDASDSYSYLWPSQFANPPPNPIANDTKMKAAYSAATVAHPFRNTDKPQYYATSDAMDNDRIGSSPDKKYAMIFVGNDFFSQGDDKPPARLPVSWNHAVLMYERLIARGYPAGNISVYYSNFNGAEADSKGKPPNAVGNMPVDGNATVANFRTFFNLGVGADVEGQNDQILIWVGDHGVDAKEFTGKIKWTPIDNHNRIAMRMELTRPSLLAMTSDVGFGDTVQLFGDALTNFLGPISIEIGDSFGGNMTHVGSIVNDQPWHFDIDRSVFDTLAQNMDAMGNITLSFVGGNSITEINNFTLSSVASPVAVPEPSTLVLLTIGAVILSRAREAVGTDIQRLDDTL